MRRRLSAVIPLAGVLFLATVASARGLIFTVNSTADTNVCGGGTCTLRGAINAANANPGGDVIVFSIGTGMQVIAPATPLPAITEVATIDGTFQPGYSGVPLIVLDGTNTVSVGLTVNATAATTLIKALVICRFTQDGVHMMGSGSAVQASYIGTDPTGLVAKPNGRYGVFVDTVTDGKVGGENPGDGNLISGNTSDGIHVTGGTGALIEANLIGLDATGAAALPNGGNGVVIDSNGNGRVGSTVLAARNWISGNGANGVLLTGASTTSFLVVTNFIGTNQAGSAGVPNALDGVRIDAGAHDNAVGRDPTIDPISANLIAFNTGRGINLTATAGVGNSLRANSIHSNGNLGIDLGNDGLTLNDTGDPDTGPNNLQNFPVITSAAAGSSPRIIGTLNSTAGTTFNIDFYANAAADPTGYGEGQTYLGKTQVTADGSGNASFDVVLSTALPNGQFVTATATDSSDNTSEFSLAVAATTTGTSFFTLTPCRVLDTRDPNGPHGGPVLAANSTRTVPFASYCGIPPTAVSVAIVVVAVAPTEIGDIRLYPTGTPPPTTSALNYKPNRNRANNGIIPLGASGQMDIQNDMSPGSTGSTHLVIDVYGYFQ